MLSNASDQLSAVFRFFYDVQEVISAVDSRHTTVFFYKFKHNTRILGGNRISRRKVGAWNLQITGRI